jgi:hypothetical protein
MSRFSSRPTYFIRDGPFKLRPVGFRTPDSGVEHLGHPRLVIGPAVAARKKAGLGKAQDRRTLREFQFPE